MPSMLNLASKMGFKNGFNIENWQEGKGEDHKRIGPELLNAIR